MLGLVLTFWVSQVDAYNLSLRTPRLNSVAASLSVTGTVVEVQTDVSYDAKGAASLSATVDGSPATCAGSVTASPDRAAYHFVIRDTNSGAVVMMTGVSTSATVRVSYSGPIGRLKNALVPVTIDVDTAVTASIDLAPTINTKNVISGASEIETGFATNVPSPGTVRGKVSTNGLVWSARHGTRTARFQGKRVGDNFVGI